MNYDNIFNINSKGENRMASKKKHKNLSQNNEETKDGKIEKTKEDDEIKNEDNSGKKEENYEEKESEIKNNNTKNETAMLKVEKATVPACKKEDESKNASQKSNLSILFYVFLIIIVVCMFSTVFALMNITKSVIVSGVSIKGIDVSNLTISEATKKVTDVLNVELNATIDLKGNEYETTLNTSQIEFAYDISKTVQEAYQIGRNENIIKANYEILFTLFREKELELDYTYNEDTLNYIVDTIESKMPGLVVEASYYREGNELIIIPGKNGITVDKDKLKQEIINTILSQNAEEILVNNTNKIIEIPLIETSAKPIDVEKIYAEVHTEPKDAYYEENPFKIYAEVEGVDFAITQDEVKAIIATPAEEYRVPLKLTPASKTINDIGTEAFPYEISTFSTKYDASNRNRSQNLAIATNKINGTVLMPGEEFSFNKVVGQRTIAEGYKDAKIYQNGEVVDGLAGGICQISSTLYNAAVMANLEIVERRNHSFTTSYVPAGKDATVVYGVIDFRFKNSRTYPIKITASVNSGIAKFTINGIKEEVEYDIKLAPVVTASIPYTTQQIPDATLAPGQQVVVQKGGNGCKVSTYKETRLEGKLISRELISTDTYNAMKAIVRVGQ